MSFFRKMAGAFRAVNEGHETAKAHRMAEEFLGVRLPSDVGADGFEIVARMASLYSVEEMALVYVATYAKRMALYLDEVNATQDFRMQVTRNIARACILLARLQRSGTRFDIFWTNYLIQAAKKHGVNTESDEISFAA